MSNLVEFLHETPSRMSFFENDTVYEHVIACKLKVQNFLQRHIHTVPMVLGVQTAGADSPRASHSAT